MEAIRKTGFSTRHSRGRTMPDIQDEAALAEWESDGGRTNAEPRNTSHSGDPPWPPPLPPGYTAQPVSEFGDGTGRFSYEFNRVYGPPTRLDRRGPICLQDEARSYWCVTWSVANDTGDSRLTGRALSYAEARRLLGSRMTFDRFFALREQVPELLHPSVEDGHLS